MNGLSMFKDKRGRVMGMESSANRSYLKQFVAHERDHRYGEALGVLSVASQDKHYVGLRGVIEANVDRLAFRAQQQARVRDMTSTPIFEHKENPRTYPDSSSSKENRPLVALTAISTRIDRLHETISTILDQTVEPHSVNLYVSPDPYLIDEGLSRDDPRLKKIFELGANVYFSGNIGPYRKQFPIIKQLHDAGASGDTCFVTIDDDVIYPDTILEQLMAVASKTNAVVSHRGRKITFKENWFDKYKQFVTPGKEPDILNIGTGRNGIAYRLKHFPTSYEDFVGPCLAPTADDLWCKYITAKYCIPTIILEPTAMYDTEVDFKETAPTDKRGLFHNFNAKGRNDIALAALELYFGRQSAGILDLVGLSYA